MRRTVSKIDADEVTTFTMAAHLSIACTPDTPRHRRRLVLLRAGYESEEIDKFLPGAEALVGLQEIPPPKLRVIAGGKS
jgi:hypothetical protein